MTYQEQKTALLASFGTSYWLKDAIAKIDARDPVDAANDVAILGDLLNLRCSETLAQRVTL